MRDYGPEIGRCGDVAKIAECDGDARLAKAARRLARSFKRWEKDEFSGSSTMRVLEGRRDSDAHHIDRLMTLCKVSLQSIGESADIWEVQGLRSYLARYRHEMEAYELDSDVVSEQLHELESKQ